MRRGGLLGALLLALWPGSGALAAGWTQPEGEFYIKAWDRSMFGSKVFLADGSVGSLPSSYADHAIHYYVEFGLTDDLTITVRGTPIADASFGPRSILYTGLGLAGLRYALLTRPVALALELLGGFAIGPGLGDHTLAAGMIGNQAWVYVPSIGTVAFGGEFQLGVPLPFGWFAASFGARGFTNPAIDPQLVGSLELGVRPPGPFTIEAHMKGEQHVGPPITVANIAGIGRTDYLAAGISASWWFLPFMSLMVGVDAPIAAQGIAATFPILVGFELKNP
jgi:hypothetical protein